MSFSFLKKTPVKHGVTDDEIYQTTRAIAKQSDDLYTKLQQLKHFLTVNMVSIDRETEIVKDRWPAFKSLMGRNLQLADILPQLVIPEKTNAFFSPDFDLEQIMSNALQQIEGKPQYRLYFKDFLKQKETLEKSEKILGCKHKTRATEVQKRFGHALWQLDATWFNTGGLLDEVGVAAIFDDAFQHCCKQRPGNEVVIPIALVKPVNADTLREIAQFFQMTVPDFMAQLRAKLPPANFAANAVLAP